MIETRNLTVMLGGRAVVRDASLSFQRGRVTAILGPNGAGKTSLIRALAGLIPARDILVDGTAVEALPLSDRARRIGYLPQNGTPAWNVTARELVALGRLPHRDRFAAERDADRLAVDAAMRATDTLHLADRTVDTLSGGERARVKIARVLAGDPDWVIADEPLANLDPPHQRDTLALFRAAASAGKGVIVVLHQLNAALRAADDVVLLRDGVVLKAGTKSDVLTPETLAEAFGMPFHLLTDGDQSAITPLS